MEIGIPARLSSGELRKFGLTVGGAFGVLAAISRWRGHPTSTMVFGVVALLLLLGGGVAPAVLAPVYRAWMGLAKVLSRITTPIFLGVMYFVIFTPVGLVKRALGKNELVRKPEGGSYFLKRKQRVSGSMENMF